VKGDADRPIEAAPDGRNQRLRFRIQPPLPPRVEAHGNDGVLVYAVLRIRHISKHLTMLRPGFGLSADGSALDAPCLLNHSSVAVKVGPEATAEGLRDQRVGLGD
jgi:hypothetical protein